MLIYKCVTTESVCHLTHLPTPTNSQFVEGPPTAKRSRRSECEPFNFRSHCLYCGEICHVEKDRKNPKRWIPAFIVKEVDTNEKDESMAKI